MRRLLAITLASLTAVGGVAYAASAIRARSQPRFTVSVSPGHQSAVRGGTASFSVNVVRAKGFSGVVTLNTSDLPRGVSASWRLADGTRSGSVPRTESGATLTLRTSADTPMGTRRVKVLATGGRTARAIPLALTLIPNSLRRFSLSVTPARRTVPPGGATATYRFHIARARRFHRRVSLRVLALPRGATATWSTNAVAVRTPSSLKPGSARIVIQGTSWVGGRAVRRNAIVVLSVLQGREFRIAGDLATHLYPGATIPLDLVLTNPNPFDLRIRELGVSIASSTTKAGCDGTANYAAAQYGGAYPLRLRPGRTRLGALVGNPSLWPRVSMRDLPTDQDACRGATVSFAYRGTATR